MWMRHRETPLEGGLPVCIWGVYGISRSTRGRSKPEIRSTLPGHRVMAGAHPMANRLSRQTSRRSFRNLVSKKTPVRTWSRKRRRSALGLEKVSKTTVRSSSKARTIDRSSLTPRPPRNRSGRPKGAALFGFGEGAGEESERASPGGGCLAVSTETHPGGGT